MYILTDIHIAMHIQMCIDSYICILHVRGNIYTSIPLPSLQFLACH